MMPEVITRKSPSATEIFVIPSKSAIPVQQVSARLTTPESSLNQVRKNLRMSIGHDPQAIESTSHKFGRRDASMNARHFGTCRPDPRTPPYQEELTSEPVCSANRRFNYAKKSRRDATRGIAVVFLVNRRRLEPTLELPAGPALCRGHTLANSPRGRLQEE